MIIKQYGSEDLKNLLSDVLTSMEFEIELMIKNII